jgi:hypothetical protein
MKLSAAKFWANPDRCSSINENIGGAQRLYRLRQIAAPQTTARQADWSATRFNSPQVPVSAVGACTREVDQQETNWISCAEPLRQPASVRLDRSRSPACGSQPFIPTFRS